MNEVFYIAVCSLGQNPNLPKCIAKLLEIKSSAVPDVKILLVINSHHVDYTFDDAVLIAFEPERGYSNVRNKAISLVPDYANVVFVDDDEIPTLMWFQALVEASQNHPHDVIFGPVYSFDSRETLSYRNQASKRYKKLSDGDLVRQAPTANMLIPSILLQKKVVWFDPVFNYSGSEDTDLCFRLRKLGVKIRYSERAIIYEREKAQRFDAEYIQARQKKDITNYSVVIRRNSSAGEILWRFSTLAIRITVYAILSLFNSSYISKRNIFCASAMALITGKSKEV